jgi:protein-tyrosine phosphatase
MFSYWVQVWKIRERLYLGNYWSGERALLGHSLPVEPDGPSLPFAGVVSLCPVPIENADPLIRPINPDTEWLHLPIADGGSGEGEFEAVCDLAIPFIRRARQRGNVLVHCTAGMSRSVSLVAAVLCSDDPNLDVAQAYAEVALAKGKAMGIEPGDAELLIAPAWEFRVHLRQRFERKPPGSERSATADEKKQNAKSGQKPDTFC